MEQADNQLTESEVRKMARRAGLRLHKSRVRQPGHPERGKYWLMQADNYHPAAGYQGYAHLTLERAAQAVQAVGGRR